MWTGPGRPLVASANARAKTCGISSGFSIDTLHFVTSANMRTRKSGRSTPWNDSYDAPVGTAPLMWISGAAAM
jgi:hypothetical protein